MKTISAVAALSIVGLLACAWTPSQDSAALHAIIADIETGWETGDGVPFRTHYLDFPGARYIEAGVQNEGLRDLIENHVEQHGETMDSMALEYSNIETHFEGRFAWAIADLDGQATIGGRQLHFRGYETFLFRHVDGAWTVVHTHSSTGPVQP